MRLAELQALFWRAVRNDKPPPELEAAFVGRGALGAKRRMEIYHNAYWARHERGLRDTYPLLLAELGDGAFRTLTASYMRANPSRRPAIEWAGQQLAAHLRRHAEALGHPVWLAGLAALEWARMEARLAPDAPPELTAAMLAEPDAALRRICTAPCLQLVHADARAVAVVMRKPADQPSNEQIWVALWRRGRQVHVLTLDEDHAHALEQAMQGATLARACAEIEADDPVDPVERAANLLALWIERGWMIGLIGWEDNDDMDRHANPQS